MESDYYAVATDLLNSGMGDRGRLKFILECIAKNKPLYKTDKIFLESMNEKLEAKIQKLQTGSAAPKAAKQKKVEEAPKAAKQKKVEEAPKAAKQKKVEEAPKAAKQKKVEEAPKAAKQKKVEEAPKAAKQKKVEEAPKAAKPVSDKIKTLISDEHLDQHLDQISDRKNTRKAQVQPVAERKKSFFGRLFSR